MTDYPARILPYTKEKLEVNLSLTISRNILSLHKRWICRNSFCLTWNPENYDGIKLIEINIKEEGIEIWIPKLKKQ